MSEYFNFTLSAFSNTAHLLQLHNILLIKETMKFYPKKLERTVESSTSETHGFNHDSEKVKIKLIKPVVRFVQ